MGERARASGDCVAQTRSLEVAKRGSTAFCMCERQRGKKKRKKKERNVATTADKGKYRVYCECVTIQCKGGRTFLCGVMGSFWWVHLVWGVSVIPSMWVQVGVCGRLWLCERTYLALDRHGETTECEHCTSMGGGWATVGDV